MLNEKRVMKDKLFSLVFFAIMTGFLSGVGVCLVAMALIPEEVNSFALIAGLLCVGGCCVTVKFGDSLHRQVRNFIMSPYVKPYTTVGEHDDK